MSIVYDYKAIREGMREKGMDVCAEPEEEKPQPQGGPVFAHQKVIVGECPREHFIHRAARQIGKTAGMEAKLREAGIEIDTPITPDGQPVKTLEEVMSDPPNWAKFKQSESRLHRPPVTENKVVIIPEDMIIDGMELRAGEAVLIVRDRQPAKPVTVSFDIETQDMDNWLEKAMRDKWSR